MSINVAIVIKSFPRSLLEGAPEFLTVRQTGRSNRQFSLFFVFHPFFGGCLFNMLPRRLASIIFNEKFIQPLSVEGDEIECSHITVIVAMTTVIGSADSSWN